MSQKQQLPYEYENVEYKLDSNGKPLLPVLERVNGEKKFYLIIEQTITTRCVIVEAKSMTECRVKRHMPKDRIDVGEVSNDSVIGVGVFEDFDSAGLRAKKELYGSRHYLEEDKFIDRYNKMHQNTKEVYPDVDEYEGVDFTDEWEEMHAAMERDGD